MRKGITWDSPKPGCWCPGEDSTDWRKGAPVLNSGVAKRLDTTKSTPDASPVRTRRRSALKLGDDFRGDVGNRPTESPESRANTSSECSPHTQKKRGQVGNKRGTSDSAFRSAPQVAALLAALPAICAEVERLLDRVESLLGAADELHRLLSLSEHGARRVAGRCCHR